MSAAPPLCAQLVVAGVDRDARNPGFKRAAQREGRQRKERLGEDLLRDVFDLIAAAKEAADYGEDARAVAPHQHLEGVVVAGEAAFDERVFSRVDRLVRLQRLTDGLTVGRRHRPHAAARFGGNARGRALCAAMIALSQIKLHW